MGAFLRAGPTRKALRGGIVSRGHGAQHRRVNRNIRQAPLPTLRRNSLFSFLFSLFYVSPFSLSSSFFSYSLFAAPIEGWAERRQPLGCQRAPATCQSAWQARHPAGGPAPLNGGRRASRRSTVAILGRGPRFLLRHFLRIRTASSSQPGRR